VQVLVNLLGNAIKFTPHGEVRLVLSAHGDRVRFEVRDTGIGIAEHQQPQLFRRFVQADDSIQQRYGGNGLGLAISRRLVELMGGELDFHSVLGEGSSFFFDLHLPSQEAPTAVEDTAPAPLRTAEQAWCFLVVDDHPVNRLLVQRVLASNWPQARVLEAADGLEALAAVQATQVDAVLMDMRMPVMDGIDATEAIRRLPGRESHTVIMGLTANVNQDDLARFQAAGLDALMLKPFNWRQLCAEMESLLLQRAASGR
jgi:CheY-like chemotaxis protein